MSREGFTLGSPPSGVRQDLVDKAVADAFDELFTEISTKTKLHRSEQVSRDNRFGNWINSKIYDFINSYHAFCKLCEQHFYTRSVANDINSFFQKHVNTSYHRQLRTTGLLPDDVPMLTWEQTLHSARCNVCELSGLSSFVISTKFCIMKLIRQHVCVWPSDQRETNDKFLRKLNLLKKYCGLKIFQEKFIKTINGKEVCLLCGVILPWRGTKAFCHLKSDAHYQKFCMFIWTNFHFAPKDILNGFNLEAVTRCWIVHDPPMSNNYRVYNELAVCLKETNNCENPYPEDKKNLSYSPAYVKLLLRDEDVDFIYRNECLLCDVELTVGHFGSSLHLSKVADFSESSFEPNKYAIYVQNRKNRLSTFVELISSYERLEKELKSEKNSFSFQTGYLKALISKKLSLMDEVLTAVDDVDVLCQICDRYLRKSCQQAHLDSGEHKFQMEKWNELQEKLSDERFLEPFKKIRNVILCLLCGAMITPRSFFFHLKSETHAQRFEAYVSQKFSIPISWAFEFQEDFSCFCTICKSSLSKKKSLKATLMDIRCHWPCPMSEEDRREDLANGMEVTLQQDAAGPDEEEEDLGKGDAEAGEMAETLVNMFEEKRTTNSAPYKSANSSKLVDAQANLKRSVKVERSPSGGAPVEPVPGADQLSGSACGCVSTCTCSEPGSGNASKGKEEKRKGSRGDRMEEEKRTEVKTEQGDNGRKEKATEMKSDGREEKRTEMKIEERNEERGVKKSEMKSDGREEKRTEMKIEERNEEREVNRTEVRIEQRSDEGGVKKTEMKSDGREGKRTEMKTEERNEERGVKKTEMRIEQKSEGGKEKKKTETNIEKKSVGKKEEDETRGKDVVLVLKGLPKKKRKYDILYSRLEVFGKIKYVWFDAKAAVVAFVEPGCADAAAAAAAEVRKIMQEPRLGVVVTERRFKEKQGKSEGDILSLHEDVVKMLQDPHQLMDFMLCLIYQAVTASQSPTETKREEVVCNMIIQAVFDKFPFCRCYPFGSRLTGLSLNSSDLDVFLDCGGMYEGFKNTTSITEKKLVRTVAGALRKVKDVSDIIVVDSARVPIVSFLHKPTRLHCDISFKSGLSIQNSLLIKFLVSLDWRVKPLILFMKCWAKLNGLHGPPYFSSYALSMLVINYLEQLESPVLPTIESLQSSYVGRRITIGGWDCSINTNKATLPKLDNTDPLPILLAGLFEFYADFDFRKYVVFPLTGKSLPREAFSESGKGKLPMSYKRHIINVPVPIENLVSDKFPICIVDPFDLSHVLTKSFTTQGFLQFVHFCNLSRQYLKEVSDPLPQA